MPNWESLFWTVWCTKWKLGLTITWMRSCGCASRDLCEQTNKKQSNWDRSCKRAVPQSLFGKRVSVEGHAVKTEDEVIRWTQKTLFLVICTHTETQRKTYYISQNGLFTRRQTKWNSVHQTHKKQWLSWSFHFWDKIKFLRYGRREPICPVMFCMHTQNNEHTSTDFSW